MIRLRKGRASGLLVSCRVCGGRMRRLLDDAASTEMYCRRCGYMWEEPEQILHIAERVASDGDWWKHTGTGKQRVFDRLLDEAERRLGVGTLLDVGCGVGGLLLHAGRRGWKGVGIDVNVKSVAAARGRGLHAEHADICELPADAKFDLICFVDSIEYCPDPHSQLRAARSLLRPGGIVEVVDLNSRWHVHARRVGASQFRLAPDGAHRVVAIARRSIAAMLAEAGFAVEAIVPAPARMTGNPFERAARRAVEAAAEACWRATNVVVAPSFMAIGRG